VKVAGSHAYLVGGNELVVFDISDPTHPTQQAYRFIYNSAASLFGVDVAGTLAYVIGHTDNDGYLEVIDVNKLTGDLMLGALTDRELPASTTGIQVAGNLAYIAAEQGGLEVLRIRAEYATPVPTQIAPAGGSLTNYDRHVALQFPPNSVTSPITVTFTGLFSSSQALGSGQSAAQNFRLEARDSDGNLVTHFAKPYTLTISYDDAELAALGIDESRLNLAFWDSSAWIDVLPCAGCGVDTVNNRLTAVLDHFTEFALLGGELPAAGDGKSRVYLPMVRR
jgi:hypothetical protein